MKYLSTKKTLLLLFVNTFVVGALWVLPSVVENMIFQKAVVIALTVIGVLLAMAFYVVNGMSTALLEGTYEKEYYSHLKKGKALDEGQNLRYNPLKLSLCKRIYYAKLLLTFLFPIILVYLFECVMMLIERF